jgi:hypothetical protein
VERGAEHAAQMSPHAPMTLNPEFALRQFFVPLLFCVARSRRILSEKNPPRSWPLNVIAHRPAAVH